MSRTFRLPISMRSTQSSSGSANKWKKLFGFFIQTLETAFKHGYNRRKSICSTSDQGWSRRNEAQPSIRP